MTKYIGRDGRPLCTTHLLADGCPACGEIVVAGFPGQLKWVRQGMDVVHRKPCECGREIEWRFTTGTEGRS